MKRRRFALLCSIGLILVLVASLVLAACAPAAPTPGAPTRITPQVPEQKQQAPITVTPTVPKAAKPAPAPAPSAEVFNWKYQANADSTNPQYLGIKAWADMVKEVTGGRLVIEVYPVGQLIKGVDALDALRENTIEGAETSPGYYKGFMPEGSILAGFPGIMQNAADMDAIFYDKGVIELAREAFAEHGAYMLSPWGYGQVPIWGKSPLRTLADFDGVKIRAYGDMTLMLESWGSAVTYIPHDESYTALQLGTVDFYSTGLTGWLSFKHFEICPYVMQPAAVGMGMSTNSVGIIAYDDLSEDLQMVIDASATWLGRACTYKTVVGENMILANPAKYGGEIVQMSGEVAKAMSEAGVGFLEEYIQQGGRPGQMAQIMKDFVVEMGYLD